MDVKLVECWYIWPINTVDKFSILPKQLVAATSFQMLRMVDHQFEPAGCLGGAGGNAAMLTGSRKVNRRANAYPIGAFCTILLMMARINAASSFRKRSNAPSLIYFFHRRQLTTDKGHERIIALKRCQEWLQLRGDRHEGISLHSARLLPPEGATCYYNLTFSVAAFSSSIL